MLLELTPEQQEALLKEKLDSMTDTEFLKFCKQIAQEAVLRNLKVTFEVHEKYRGIRRIRNG